MTSGGARSRSGPGADPSSARSDRRGLLWRPLPRQGYAGPVPTFSVPDPSPREEQVWAELWRTPQAAAWHEQPWRWPMVATYARLSARTESADCSAPVIGQWLRLADQLGLTPAGMKENQWVVEEAAAAAPEASSASAPLQRRLRAVPGAEGMQHRARESALERSRRLAEGRPEWDPDDD